MESGLETEAQTSGLQPPRRYRAILAIWLAIAMAILDSAVVAIALPTLATELLVSPASVMWVVTAYQIAVLVALLPLASLGEGLGYRQVYLFGIAMFVLGSLGAVLSSTFTALVLARFVQGLGASSIQAMNGALLRFTFPREHLGRGI